MTKKQKLGRGSVALVSVLGALAAGYLNQVHVAGRIGEKASSGLCNVDGFINCDAAAQSAFSTVLGIPIALLGLAFYVAMLVVMFLPARSKGKGKKRSDAGGSVWSPAAIAVTLFGASLVYSLFLLVVSLTTSSTSADSSRRWPGLGTSRRWPSQGR
jgi:uncharacterized membrane protein